MKSSIRSLLLGAVLTSAAGAFSAGCSGADSGSESQSGVLSMPLVVTASSGSVFRLRDADFAIAGAQTATGSSETDPNATELTFELKQGGYTIKLKSGWHMEKEVNGVFEPVKAVLTSSNPIAFTITDQGTTSVAFQFNAGEDVVAIGNGSLVVSIGVHDSDSSIPDTVDVDGLTPEAVDIFANGGGMAAKDGFTYIQDSVGSPGMEDEIWRVDPDGNLDVFITGVANGFRPIISLDGTLLIFGMDFDWDPPQMRIPRVDEYSLSTGAYIGNIYQELQNTWWPTSMTQKPNGDLIFGTEDTDNGIRQIVPPNLSSKIYDGYGNNVHLASSSTGDLLIATGWSVGHIVDGQFEQVLDTGGMYTSGIAVLPNDAVVVSTANYSDCGSSCVGSVLWGSPDLTTWTELLTTDGSDGYQHNYGGFNAVTYDATTHEVVAMQTDGKLYRIGL
jgi:hypothetical protein